VTPCGRQPAAADRDRKVVVAHPYDSAGGQASDWEVFDLSAAGVLSETGVTFQMGRAGLGEVAFTIDGQVGLVAQEDGTVGVLSFDGAGNLQVVHAGFSGSFYAAQVVMDPDDPDRAWVLDAQWRENGGGLYRVRIGCDGTLTDEGRQVEAKLPYGLAWVPDGSGRAVMAGNDVLDSAAEQDAHLLQWGPPAAVLGSTVAFSDDDDIIGSLAVTADGAYALVGDAQGVFSTPNRVAVVRIDAQGLTPLQELSPIPDPIALVASPHDDVVLVVSGMGDAFYVLERDAGSPSAPFVLAGEPTYSGSPPALPAGAVMIRRGALRGRVIVSENTGIRMVDLEGEGVVTDHGVFDLGAGLDRITGAIGVQP
jgi:hypothetical protein